MDEVLTELSEILNEEVFSAWHHLKPTLHSKASPVSYSGIFGLNEFPLHTDMAHWKRPPRYLVLVSEKGSADVRTPLLDSSKLIETIGYQKLTRALVQPRRPVRGRLPLMRLLQAANENISIFRWDSVFLKPASPAGATGVAALENAIAAEVSYPLCLHDQGCGVVIDNWRMLHGRSAVEQKDQCRLISRAYLGRAA